MDETTTIVIGVLGGLALLVGVYILTQPPPPPKSASLDDLIDLGTKVVAIYYGVGV